MLSIEIADQDHQLTAIESLAKTIWREHYTPIIGPDQVEYMLDKFQSLSAMKYQITHENYRYFSLLIESSLVGYMAIQPNDEHLLLSKFYLAKSMRGQGHSRDALEHIKRIAQQMTIPAIRLTVNKYNETAIRAYQRLGFAKIDQAIFDIGNGYVMDDYIYQLSLKVSAP